MGEEIRHPGKLKAGTQAIDNAAGQRLHQLLVWDGIEILAQIGIADRIPPNLEGPGL
jgi:hypothetical protein